MPTYPSGPLGKRYRTTADDCRDALKAAGYSARQVTVRSESWSCPKVTIRDASVRISAVREILNAAIPTRTVDCDGDTFVRSGYEAEYLAAIVKPIADAIEARLCGADRMAVEVFPGVRLSHDGSNHTERVVRWEIGSRTGSTFCYGLRHAAERIAVEALDRGYGAPRASNWINALDLDDAPTCAHGASLDGPCSACLAALARDVATESPRPALSIVR